jgi:hypothetical protein
MATLSFLDLPGEIRNQIYYQLLVLPSLSTTRCLPNSSLYPQILSVCRKIYTESQQILYGSNTFLAHSNLLTGLPRLRVCYATISSQKLISLIRRYHIRVRLDCDPNFEKERAIEAFSGIEELTIEVFQAQFGSSDYKVLRLFEGVRGIRKARVYGSVQAFPDYVEWLKNAMETPKNIEIGVFDKLYMERVLAHQVSSYNT